MLKIHGKISHMPNDLASFFASSQPWIAVFNTWSGPFVSIATADHLCFKCASSAEFESLRAMFEAESAFIYQSIISNRRIVIIKFLKPVTTILGDIWFLELSDQKPDKSQSSGFDHIEIFPTSGSLESLVEKIESTGQTLEKVVRPHHTTFDIAISGNFKVRLEPNALVEKIKVEEM